MTANAPGPMALPVVYFIVGIHTAAWLAGSAAHARDAPLNLATAMMARICPQI